MLFYLFSVDQKEGHDNATFVWLQFIIQLDFRKLGQLSILDD